MLTFVRGGGPFITIQRKLNEKPPEAGGFSYERETGLEPATSTLARWRSTTELFPRVVTDSYLA